LKLRHLAAVLLLCLMCAGCGGKDKDESFTQESLSLVVTEQSIAQLENYKNLRSLDLSGSTCYDSIMRYIADHPEVDVRYSVQVDELTVGSRQKSLSIENDSYAEELIRLACYLPELEQISITGEETSAELIIALQGAYPEAELEYALNVLGLEVGCHDKSMSIPELTSEELPVLLKALECLPELEYVDLGHRSESRGALCLEDVARLQQLRPDVVFDFDFTLFDREFSTGDELMDLSGIKMEDGGAMLCSVLPYMNKCRYLDMDGCGLTDEQMLSIRDAYPHIKVVWRVSFGQKYSVRTDVTTILASSDSEILNSDCVEALSYCRDVEYLDLGGNIINDISFVSQMPKLKVAILSSNYWTDASPLADCTELEYLEIQKTGCTDLSPLSGLSGLKHLNISGLDVSDLTPLYSLTGLERLWIGWSQSVPENQTEELARLLPDCEINTTDGQGNYGWYQGARYELLRQQFGYQPEDYSFYYNDPKYKGSSGS